MRPRPSTPMLIPSRTLVASGDFGARLSAGAVAAAISRGLAEGGQAEADLCGLPGPVEEKSTAKEMLDSLHFDARMRAARAVIVADEHLRESTLAGSITFEIATRARQAGVPAYAISARNDLDAFDSRILDLQVILEARSPRAIAAAARKLAGLL